jgi:phosphatidylserine decarboxylase
MSDLFRQLLLPLILKKNNSKLIPVYIGRWSEGFFSMAAVGATNVGSIQVEFDETLKTNTKQKLACDEIVFQEKVPLEKGQHVGLFNLGSTIVLVFEAPEGFRFDVQPGQRVLMGEAIGRCQTK